MINNFQQPLKKVFAWYLKDGVLITLKKLYFAILIRKRRAFLYLLHFLNFKKVVSFYEVILFPVWKDATFKLCYSGAYGNVLSSLLTNHNKPYIFLDIGANQGLFSLIANKSSFCQKIFAFEPVRQTYQILIKNKKLNNAKKIKCYKLAISDFNRFEKIAIPHQHSGRASLRKLDYLDSNFKIEKVKCINYLYLNKILSSDYEVIVKIDVEGHEFNVISQLLKSKVSKKITIIFYEIDTKWSSDQKIRKILRMNSFTHFKKILSNTNSHYDVIALKKLKK